MSSNDYPFLVVLDSVGRSQDYAIRLVREYLQIEWSLKVNAVEPVYGAQALPLTLPEKPLQKNRTDCGVFLLHYAELLLKDFHLYLFPGQYSSLVY